MLQKLIILFRKNTLKKDIIQYKLASTTNKIKE